MWQQSIQYAKGYNVHNGIKAPKIMSSETDVALKAKSGTGAISKAPLVLISAGVF